MKLNSAVLMLFVFAITQVGCGKDKTPKPVTEVAIGPQTLAEVKATVQGMWKLHYSIGGYTGKIRVDFLNTILLITTNDSLYRWDDNLQTISSRITYNYLNVVYTLNYYTYLIEIENPNNMMSGLQTAYSKKGDTLIMVETQQSHPEKYYLTRN
jgi:hypothetical protein